MSLNQQGMLDEGKDRTDGNSKSPVWSPGWMLQVCETGTLEQYLKEDELFQN